MGLWVFSAGPRIREGSVLHALREKQWATSAGLSEDSEWFAVYSVDIALSNAGLAHASEVAHLVYAYVSLLVKGGVTETVFKQIQKVEEIAFRFQEAPRPQRLVENLAVAMQDTQVPVSLLLGPPSALTFSEHLITQCLMFLTPANSVAVLASPTFANLSQTEPWYALVLCSLRMRTHRNSCQKQRTTHQNTKQKGKGQTKRTKRERNARGEDTFHRQKNPCASLSPLDYFFFFLQVRHRVRGCAPACRVDRGFPRRQQRAGCDGGVAAPAAAQHPFTVCVRPQH
jgi:hypothetical protein